MQFGVQWNRYFFKVQDIKHFLSLVRAQEGEQKQKKPHFCVAFLSMY